VNGPALPVPKENFFGDVAFLIRAFGQAVLVLLSASDIEKQRQNLHYDAVGILAGIDEVSGFSQVIWVLAVHARAVFQSDIGALSVQAVRINDFKKVAHQFRNAQFR
jgi:hypothetical protein